MSTPVLEDWFGETDGRAHLIGSRCRKCGTYYFPKAGSFCRNPDCDSTEFEDTPLSGTGRLWSYTNAAYKPPEPYIAADPFVPFAIAAVELERERMTVLGQVVSGIGVETLRVGMPMELVIETLSTDASGEKTVWKWKPVEQTS